MLKYWPLLLYFVPGTIVVSALAYKALRPSSFWAISWRRAVLGVTCFSLVSQIVAYAFAAGPSLLGRDLIAVGCLAIAVPLCMGGLVVALRAHGWSTKAAATLGAIVGLLLVGITPPVILVAHCTSGDCL
jgi:hypothetical protein